MRVPTCRSGASAGMTHSWSPGYQSMMRPHGAQHHSLAGASIITHSYLLGHTDTSAILHLVVHNEIQFFVAKFVIQ